MNIPSFEYDPDKSRLNREKHGIDFEEAQELWRTDHVVIPARKMMGEDRSLILGVLNQRVYVAVFTERQAVVRLITCHRADTRLQKIYETWSYEKEKS